MDIKRILQKIFVKEEKDLNFTQTKRDAVILVLSIFVVLLTFLNYRLVPLDFVAILGYYFMPRYAYDSAGVWKVVGKKRKLWFAWKEVKEIDLNRGNLYFLLERQSREDIGRQRRLRSVHRNEERNLDFSLANWGVYRCRRFNRVNPGRISGSLICDSGAPASTVLCTTILLILIPPVREVNFSPLPTR